jgi:hypothetical protein
MDINSTTLTNIDLAAVLPDKGGMSEHNIPSWEVQTIFGTL